jgi:tRNA A37 methylthiotransferase MiaB
MADAPEIDNAVIFGAPFRLEAGKFYQVRITRAEAFDLYGEVC